jgi:mannose/cellobiose epimerase-like protein (N-acyl-D-glucosamine 2-epimerase family)
MALIALFASANILRADKKAPSPEKMQSQASRCRKILDASIVTFYLPNCVDRTNGGYLESLKDDKFAPTGEKFLTLQGRQLWFFSTLAHEGIEKEAALAAAKTGFEFLEKHMRDPKHGGYFSKVSDDGKPIDNRKHVYLNAFALYGLVAYYRATKDEAALKSAQALFRVLEEKAHDAQHGGYNEFFHEDWRPIKDAKEPGYVGAIDTKTYNTHLHVLEALAELYRVWPDPLVAKRLEETILINTNTVRHPDYYCNIDGWHPDWRMVESPQNLRASYGHDVECAWLTMDAARTLKLSPDMLRGWAEALVGYSLKHGYDRELGGFYYTGPLGKPAEDTRKEWWVEAEALVSMLEMYKLTGKREYYDVFCQTLDFVEKHQVASEGSWWASRKADGSPLSSQRSSPWQGAYHSGRSMILCEKLLKDLAANPEKKETKNAQPPLERALAVVQKAAANYPKHRQCFSCHHQTMPMLAMVAARNNQRVIDSQLLQDQAKFTHKSFQGELNGLKAGKGIGGKAMTVCYGLWALRLADWKPDEITEAMVTYLLKTQHDEGYWTGQVSRPPFEESYFTATVLAIQGMKYYATAAQKSPAESAITKAKSWLTNTPAKDQEDRVFRLWGLSFLESFESREPPRPETLKELTVARQAVLGAQKEDGGWAQTDEMKSDAYATGQTLFILREVGGGSSEKAYQRGVQFLLRTQEPDGSWLVKTRSRPIQTYFDNGDPHGVDQFISTPATAWAAAALASSN